MRLLPLLFPLLALCAVEVPIGQEFPLSGGPGNASIEFRDAAGRLRPALFTAGYPAEGGSLVFTAADRLEGTVVLASKALNLLADDHRRRILGEQVVERTVDGKTVREGPAINLRLHDPGPLKSGENLKDGSTAEVAAVLTIAGREVKLTGTMTVVVREVQRRFDRVSLHASFTTDGATLDLERDRTASILIDAWCEVLPPTADKTKGRRR